MNGQPTNALLVLSKWIGQTHRSLGFSHTLNKHDVSNVFCVQPLLFFCEIGWFFNHVSFIMASQPTPTPRVPPHK